jgi:hypothetical protein
VTLWHHLIGMGEDRIPRRCLRLWQGQCTKLRSNWHSCVMEDLVKLRMVSKYNCTPEGLANARAVSSDKWLYCVREALLQHRICPDWCDQVEQRPWLHDYAPSMVTPKYGYYKIPDTEVVIKKKESIYQSYLDERNPGLRKFHTIFRAGSLPLQTCVQSHFRCGGSLGSVKCFMCGIQDETLQHFVNECPAYSDIKGRAGFVGSVDVQSVICSPNRESSRRCVKMLFEMWLERIRVWRRAHPHDKRIQPLF